MKDSKKVKAFILKINDPASEQYAKVAAKSCDDVGLDWEYFQGYQNMLGVHAWGKTGITLNKNEGRPFNWPAPMDNPPRLENPKPSEKAECCTAGHAAIWKKIADSDLDIGIVLEHDALMLHNVTDIPEGHIVTLGYKVKDPSKYDHKSAGPVKEFIKLNGHEGAHAYAMTKKTAQYLIHEIETKGRLGCVDNAYFILNQRRTQVPLCIASPTPALGWLRESTIWSESANRNYEFIPSFKEFYK